MKRSEYGHTEKGHWESKDKKENTLGCWNMVMNQQVGQFG